MISLCCVLQPGGLSLSSVLVEASPVKLEKPSSPTTLEPLNYAAFFGNGSSDAIDTSSIVISKPSIVSRNITVTYCLCMHRVEHYLCFII